MPTDNSRTYEMVTPEEFRQIRSKNFKYPDLYRAIRDLKKMAAGEGIKIHCPSKKEGLRKQRAVAQIARREKMTIRTMLRAEWLFVERRKGE